jgi:hypothetical protein
MMDCFLATLGHSFMSREKIEGFLPPLLEKDAKLAPRWKE